MTKKENKYKEISIMNVINLLSPEDSTVTLLYTLRSGCKFIFIKCCNPQLTDKIETLCYLLKTAVSCKSKAKHLYVIKNNYRVSVFFY